MKPEIFIEQGKDGIITAALCYGGKLWQMITGESGSQIGAIYAARVIKRLSPLHAIADIGGETAFLEAKSSAAPEGALVLAQVRRDAYAGKGATLTLALQLQNRAFLYRPDDKKISGGTEPLRRALREAGWKGEVRFGGDAESALAQMQTLSSVREKFATCKSPTLLLPAPDELTRFLENIPAPKSIHVGGKPLLRDLSETLPPDLAPLLTLHQGKDSVFETYDMIDQWQEAEQMEITLPHGARLIFESGQTLTAIDVDHAGGVGDPVAINKKAAPEIARHIALRNLGGLIVIDFLKMKDEAARKSVARAMEDAMRFDPYTPRAFGFTRAGLYELTRPRRGRITLDKSALL